MKKQLLPDAAVVISSNRQVVKNADQYFPYRQSSDFFYLTGIKQQECTLLIYYNSAEDKYDEILFIPRPDPARELWDGPLLSRVEVSRISGVDDIRYKQDMIKSLRSILDGLSNIYFGQAIDKYQGTCPLNEDEIRQDLSGVLSEKKEYPLDHILINLRAVKEEEELRMMKKAIQISSMAFNRVMKELKPGMKEYQLAAILSYVFLSNGVTDHAFDPIVAAGKNALTLHYISNRDSCKDGQLVLLDFGAQWEYYAADISRTIPVNGYFTKRQKQVYQSVRKVLLDAQEMMKEGLLLEDFHQAVGQLWTEEHIKLGLYTSHDVANQSPDKPLWKKYYYHGTSHSIGLDVHDSFDKKRALQEGMVLSCEPGIYIAGEGIGIRLENDILITRQGYENLTESVPLDIDEIEYLMNQS